MVIPFHPLQIETIVFGRLASQTETRQIGDIITFSRPHDFHNINTAGTLDGSSKLLETSLSTDLQEGQVLLCSTALLSIFLQL